MTMVDLAILTKWCWPAYLAAALAVGGAKGVSPTTGTAPAPTLAVAPAAPVGFKPANGYRLVKNWDFKTLIRDHAALRREFHTRYVYGNGSLDHLNDEWTRYRDQDNHVFTAQGLSLVARAVGGISPGTIESGMLRSRWAGQYGVFEIRMKVPDALGAWPAFWLNPENQKWPPEIDVVEIVNNGRDTTRHSFHFLHSKFKGGGTEAWSMFDKHQRYAPGTDYSAAFHVFSVEWSADRVRHFVDGTLVADRQYRWAQEDGSDGGPAHVLVNLAVGGNWPGPPGEKSFPVALQVDYLRVWQR